MQWGVVFHLLSTIAHYHHLLSLSNNEYYSSLYLCWWMISQLYVLFVIVIRSSQPGSDKKITEDICNITLTMKWEGHMRWHWEAWHGDTSPVNETWRWRHECSRNSVKDKVYVGECSPVCEWVSREPQDPKKCLRNQDSLFTSNVFCLYILWMCLMFLSLNLIRDEWYKSLLTCLSSFIYSWLHVN